MSVSNLVGTCWEEKDSLPDLIALFTKFDLAYFNGVLKNVVVKWSQTMTSQAGITRCNDIGIGTGAGQNGCNITVVLSEPLLRLRPRSYLVETLLHEMIHAYLFITENCIQYEREYHGHGPNFIMHMNRINNLAGTNITEYQSMRPFHDDLRFYKVNHGKCDDRFQSLCYGKVVSSDEDDEDTSGLCGGNMFHTATGFNAFRSMSKFTSPIQTDDPTSSKFSADVTFLESRYKLSSESSQSPEPKKSFKRFRES